VQEVHETMIVTTGKIIKVRAGTTLTWEFERSSETPGLVRVTSKYGRFQLPGNKEEARSLIAAYWRTVSEDIPYRDTESSEREDDSSAIRQLELE